MIRRWWFYLKFNCSPHEHVMVRVAANTRACEYVDEKGRRCGGWDGEQAWI